MFDDAGRGSGSGNVLCACRAPQGLFHNRARPTSGASERGPSYRNLKVTSVAVWAVRSHPASAARQAVYYGEQAARRRRNILLLIPLAIAAWALFIGLGIGIYEPAGMLLLIGN